MTMGHFNYGQKFAYGFLQIPQLAPNHQLPSFSFFFSLLTTSAIFSQCMLFFSFCAHSSFLDFPLGGSQKISIIIIIIIYFECVLNNNETNER